MSAGETPKTTRRQPPKRRGRGGAPRGNLNALKTGLYSKQLRGEDLGNYTGNNRLLRLNYGDENVLTSQAALEIAKAQRVMRDHPDPLGDENVRKGLDYISARVAHLLDSRSKVRERRMNAEAAAASTPQPTLIQIAQVSSGGMQRVSLRGATGAALEGWQGSDGRVYLEASDGSLRLAVVTERPELGLKMYALPEHEEEPK